MNTVTTSLEFFQISSKLSGLLVSADAQTKIDAVKSAEDFLSTLPNFIKNNKQAHGAEINALKTLIKKVKP